MASPPRRGKAHAPVLLKEVLKLLDPRPGQVVVDATLGSGGHAREILKRLGRRGRLVGIDQDPEAIRRARENLKAYPQAEYYTCNFIRLKEVLVDLNLSEVDAVLLDVGLSTEQLEEGERGFSFLKEGPLDMRMGPETVLTARDLVNGLSQEELESLFRENGEGRWARRIARAICQRRIQSPVETTGQLVRLIEGAVPRRFQFGRRHPATLVFQALRVRVNRELEALKEGLSQAGEVLRRGGRLGVISFHSLEDRIVKRTFRQWAEEGRAVILTPKPVRPARTEILENPRSRSAKLRGMEKKK